MTRFADSFGLWLGDYFLLSTILLAFAVVSITALKQPAQRMAITKSTLVALALLAALCALPRWSAVHLLTAAPQQQAQANESPTLRLDANQPAHVVPVASPHLRTPESVASVEPAPNIIAPARDWPKISWPVVLTIVYLCGAIGVMAWLSVGSLAARGLRLSATPAPAELTALLAEVAAARRPVSPKLAIPSFGETRLRGVELLLSDRITVPVALGIHDPAILLPATWEDLPRDQLRSVLAHELAHIRHRDLYWLAASRMLLVLLWAQPIYWYLRRRMRLDQEALADAAAAELTSRQHYAEQLVTWARNIAGRPAMRLSSAVGLWEGPSQMRQRIALLIDDRLTVLRQSSRSWRLATFGVCGLAAISLSLITIAPARTESPASNDTIAADQGQTAKKKQGADLTIVVAQHVLLLNGKEIITWDEVEKKLAALPEPSIAFLACYFTNGAYGTKQYDEAKSQLGELHRKYKLKGHSEGSLLPRNAPRFDRIRDPADLVVDKSLRIEGMVVNPQGKPVAGAEVVLVTPVDDSVSYKTFHVALVEGSLRNRLEDVVTDSDSDGQFALYPPKGMKYYVLALHPAVGIALIRDNTLRDDPKMHLLPWAALVSELGPEPGAKQSASLSTDLPAADGYPEIEFDQYWSDLKRNDATNAFGYSHVPPIWQTGISRDFAEADGGAIGLTAASVSLLPGEARRIDLGPLSEKQREELKWRREESQKRRDDATRRSAEDNSLNHNVSLVKNGQSWLAVPENESSIKAKFLIEPRTVKAIFAAEKTAERTPTVLSYGDGKPDGKKRYGGSGHLIRFELPEGVTKVKGIRIHGSRYGLPQAPDENFEITFLSDKRDEVLQTESAPYKLFKRGKENWVRVMFDKEVELPPKFWIALDFNAEQTKGVYVSYDTSTKGEYSRVGKAGDEDEPKKTDFDGDWMVQVMLSPPPK